MERFSRSFDIVTQSYRILLHDKELLVLPLIASVIVVAGVVAVLAGTPAGIGLFALGAIILIVFFSTLQGIFLATLFRYATEGWVPAGFSGVLLEQAFVRRDDASNHVTLNLNQRS